MPEGDTIYRSAERLRQALQDEVVVDASGRDMSAEWSTLSGARVCGVESRGKHLLVHFDDGQVVHSHLGMTGSWHIYRTGESWQKPQRQAAIVLRTETLACICFSPATLELLSATQFRRHDYLHRLGPDLLADVLDADEVLRRFRVHPSTDIGVALMNQSIVSGVGNVYKSELLYVERMSPFTQVGQLSEEQLTDLIESARRLMRQNLGHGPRRTRFHFGSQRHWVYGRQGQPCFECGNSIRLSRQGAMGRTTYWCPQCQQ